jgi:hypothetical protein
MKIARYFLYSAAVILLLTATAKFVSSSGSAKILLHHDQLIGLRFKDLYRIVGCIELVVALACVFGKRIWLQAGLITWLSTSFVAYRFGLIWVGYKKPCSCLGSLTDALHISPQSADTAMKIILAYLLIGSYATLFWLWQQKWKNLPSSSSEETIK